MHLLDAHGPVDLETTSGRTEVSEVRGDVRSRTNSGSISIDNATGAVIANNHSGSIDVFQLAGSLQAQTKSGAIRISQTKPAAITARSDSGPIKVDLASGRGYKLDAQSESGKVYGPNTTSSDRIAEIHTLKGEVGDRGPLVDLDTRSSKSATVLDIILIDTLGELDRAATAEVARSVFNERATHVFHPMWRSHWSGDRS